MRPRGLLRIVLVLLGVGLMLRLRGEIRLLSFLMPARLWYLGGGLRGD